MSRFVGKLILERTRDAWIVSRPFVFESDLLGARGFQRAVVVEEGFPTDFASIPRIFHRLLPQNGEYDAAAIIHDHLYASGMAAKSVADLVFYEAMEALDVPAWKRKVMFWAVKWCGFAAWNGHRRRQKLREVWAASYEETGSREGAKFAKSFRPGTGNTTNDEGGTLQG